MDSDLLRFWCLSEYVPSRCGVQIATKLTIKAPIL